MSEPAIVGVIGKPFRVVGPHALPAHGMARATITERTSV
jgi:hypothetical protein